MAFAYYNECDPFAAQWLRNLIAAGLIASGHVDDRRIEEVRPEDLRGFTQCHFFSGIAGVGKLRAAGNAIAPQIAAAFIQASMERTQHGAEAAT